MAKKSEAKKELEKLIIKEEQSLIEEAIVSEEPVAEASSEGNDDSVIFSGVTTTEDAIQPRLIEDEMRTNFLNYSMSVIVSRALPDARDGLKPVHRRILYSMSRNGLTPGSKHAKSASVVGDVMKYFHPHGDLSIYSALARFAQDFSVRYTLVDGQGNFGSIDGDSPAAMRYTEVRMDKPTPFLLADIEKDTVDFQDNYDGSAREPSVLPAQFPNLLVNGQIGIAVGMATEIPPHNLSEVIEATLHLLHNPEATIDELAAHIKGPDLPTSGIIYGREDLLTAYRTGRGKAVNRARAHLEEDRIIVTEIPYQVNKSLLIEKIAEYVRDKKIEGIRDIRDESNKDGIRVVFECKRDASPEIVLNTLYKLSELQTSVHFNMVALINGGRQPKLLNLKEILEEFLKHRDDVVIRRTNFDLKKTLADLHVLEGIKIALDFIDKVIALIRASYDKEEASNQLQKEFNLSEIQADAILQMRLQTLTNLDKTKIEDERLAKLELVKKLKEILEDPAVKKALIESEIRNVDDKIKSPRRTEVIDHKLGDYNKENYIVDEEVLLQLTNSQYVKYTTLDTFTVQGRGGRGKVSFNPKDDDYVTQSTVCNSHDHIYAFTNFGRVFKTRVFDLPSGSRQGRGQNLINYLKLQEKEKVNRILTVTKEEEEDLHGHLIFATKNGTVKKSLLADYKNTRSSGIIALNLREGDELIDVRLSKSDTDKIVLSANNGKTVIFDTTQVSSVGRGSTGVRGIKLKKGDALISLELSSFNFEEGGEEGDGDVALIEIVGEKKYPTLLVVTEKGFGKQTFLGSFRKTNRAASGVKTLNITKKNGKPVLINILTGDEENLVVTTKKGVTIRIEPSHISHFGRATQGVKTINLDDGDEVMSGSVN
jgi:DNA gyrase subunit A